MAWNTSIIVPDISFYQDANNTPRPVDFHKMKAAGAKGVIIRAGQNTWIDEDFRLNWRLAKEAGLLRGTYWFYDSRSTPGNQAALWLNIVGSDLPELGYWLDLEESYGGAYGGWANWKRCLNAVRASRDMVGVYTAPYYWNARKPTIASELAYFGTFPLWIANYGVSAPAIPSPWNLDKTWFWQFTSKGDGLKYGVESLSIDLNYFNGTEQLFAQRFGGVVVPPPPGGSMKYKVVWNNGVSRRTRPATANSYTGLTYQYLNVIDVVQDNIPDADDPTNPNKRWVRFADGYYGASLYPDSIGIPRIRMEKVEETPPPPPPAGKAFTFKVDGYKAVSGTLEPE